VIEGAPASSTLAGAPRSAGSYPPVFDGGPARLTIVQYFRTGNAAIKFEQVDEYVRRRLRHFLIKRKGRQLRAGEATRWTRDFFYQHGLYRLQGTIQYPETA
jgi:hypothetical protein